MLGHDGMHGFCSRNEQIPTRSKSTQMDDQRKDHADPKRLPQRNRPKQLQTHNMLTYDVENTNEGKNLQLAINPGIVPWVTEKCHKGSRWTGEIPNIDQHIINECRTRQKNLAMANDVAPQSYIVNCLKICKISDEFINLSRKPWKSVEWNWQQEGKAYLKWFSKEVYFREMCYHHYYL